MSISLKDLRTRAQRRADLEGDSFVSDDEWTDYINEAIGELHELLTNRYQDHFLKSTTITTESGVSAYDLPSDFYQVRGVDLTGGGGPYTLKPFMFAERNRLNFVGGVTVADHGFAYQIAGNQLRVIPEPNGAQTLTLWYTPSATLLEKDADKLPPHYKNSWEKYVILYAAIEALDKKRDDTTFLRAKLARAEEKITVAAEPTSGDPKRVVDVKYSHGSHPWLSN